ncbi:MAG: hypothetical protein JRM99_05960 [Nitrososphaerota archaeon]|nr:hypothetical protein [Nitrososphaerota archaeon]
MSRTTFRKKALPALGVASVLAILVISYNTSLQGPNQEFSFGIFWPAASSYVPNYTPPDAVLWINYTGPGIRTYTYSIICNSSVLESGHVAVAQNLPFRVLVFAPVPSNLQATVSQNGDAVFQQNLTLI